MMVCRRWWSLAVVILVGGLVGIALAVPPVPGTAAAMEAASGKAAADLRTAVVAAAPATSAAADRDAYGAEVVNRFAQELTSNNRDARLQTSMMIYEMGTLSTDRTLSKMVTEKESPNPEVRYWGAKGLSNIADLEKKLGGNALTAVKNALRNQAGVETSGVVLQEILKALINYKDVSGVIDGLENINKQIKASVPDRGTLDALNVAAEFLKGPEGLSTVNPKEKARGAEALAKAASFAAQQQVNFRQAQGESPLPPGYSTAVNNVVDNSVDALTVVSGKSFGWTKSTASTDADGLWIKLRGVVGSGTKKGALQDAMPGVGIPEEIISTQH